MTPWSISIKTVGGGMEAGKEHDFTVTVSPEDDMTSLFDQIEGVTGIKASQQRLIYRGRLLGGAVHNNESRSHNKIGDVTGLCDGQTIHLVPKPPSAPTTLPTESATESSTTATADNATDGTMSGAGTASLLAALLGLSADDDEDDDLAGEESTSARRRGQRERLRATRSSRSRRSANYRLTESDLVAPDPGPLEPVRQGLMTLHTMLPPACDELANATTQEETSSNYHPLNADRQWYRGQWIDCLDTVNQWLEATIVDIVRAEDVLPPRAGGRTSRQPPQQPRSATTTTADPAVTANDFEGRRLLLLEPCDENDSNEEEGELSGFRERDNNKGVQLLLVHYNGWPHRWDEWIRSDSERIRPFRTRTRHTTTAPYTSPSPQSVFHEAPATHIVDEDDGVDRQNLLPELSRVMSAVNDLLTETISPAVSAQEATPRTVNSTSHMPWLTGDNSMDADDENNNSVPSADETMDRHGGAPYTRQQLEVLAPLLDRLGRTLTDAAPHVAALSQNLTNDQNDEAADNDTTDSNSSRIGLFSLLSRQADASTPLLAPETTQEETTTRTTPNPDHVDFVHGMVNTHRGGSRRRPSDDGTGLLGAYLAAASLSNLASASSDGGGGDATRDDAAGGTLGRILRQAGGTGRGGGGGIDIHIHAIVTGPGMGPPGALGLAMMGGGMSTPTTTENRPRNSATATTNPSSELSVPATTPLPPLDNDDLGIFSDLYSESPQPTNLHGENTSEWNNSSSTTSGDATTTNTTRNEAPATRGRGLDLSRGTTTLRETQSSSARNSQERTSSVSQRSSFRRGSSFGRILRRALGGRRSSRSGNNRSTTS